MTNQIDVTQFMKHEKFPKKNVHARSIKMRARSSQPHKIYKERSMNAGKRETYGDKVLCSAIAQRRKTDKFYSE